MNTEQSEIQTYIYTQNSISTTDTSQQDSTLYSINDNITEYASQKYFMSLRPLRSLKMPTINHFQCNISSNEKNQFSNFMSNPFYLNNIHNNFSILNKQINSKFQFLTFEKNIIPVEIFSDLYEELIKEESFFPPCFGYMTQQNEINEKMRAVLVDWLSEVHLKFKLITETLFLTITIIDRYLSIKKISKNHLQLLGVGALLIACKYEEIYCPDLSVFVYITDKAYSKEEIILMEKNILHVLGFEVCYPSILKFYDLISVNFAFNEMEYYLGRYFLEMFLLDYRINKYQNSHIACSVAYLVMKINKYEDYKRINCYTLGSEKDLKNCAKEICFLVENIDSTNLMSVKNKFASKEYYEVSKISFK